MMGVDGKDGASPHCIHVAQDLTRPVYVTLHHGSSFPGLRFQRRIICPRLHTNPQFPTHLITCSMKVTFYPEPQSSLDFTFFYPM